MLFLVLITRSNSFTNNANTVDWTVSHRYIHYFTSCWVVFFTTEQKSLRSVLFVQYYIIKNLIALHHWKAAFVGKRNMFVQYVQRNHMKVNACIIHCQDRCWSKTCCVRLRQHVWTITTITAKALQVQTRICYNHNCYYKQLQKCYFTSAKLQ